MYENEVKTEKAVLAGINTGESDAELSMQELCELAHTAGAVVTATCIQKRERPEPATYLGKGKLAEIRELAENLEAELLIFDGELSPSQQRNIEDETDLAVIDRTALILDIFARHAKSREGKIQVELAQLNYRLPRLGGKGKGLSRLGGGIGTRGPGESKLESDRRHIHRRIDALERELKEVEKRREILRTKRKKNGIFTAAIVGYTNAGKSTLMNALTDAGVLAQDKLFATLDPTARALSLPSGERIMLIDTVGFVRKLPHQLVEAFKSTLEEASGADIILNVCDASSEECAEHVKITENLLNEIGCENIPIITVMNKCDLVPEVYSFPVLGNTVFISAKKKEGFEKLLNALENTLPEKRTLLKFLIPFTDVKAAAKIRQYGGVISETFTDDGIVLEAFVDKGLVKKYGGYITRL